MVSSLVFFGRKLKHSTTHRSYIGAAVEMWDDIRRMYEKKLETVICEEEVAKMS